MLLAIIKYTIEILFISRNTQCKQENALVLVDWLPELHIAIMVYK
jgi:hypothetical protein